MRHYAIDLLRQWRIICYMVFIETPVFERDRAEYFTDEVFAQLEQALADDPEGGDIIPHGKGLRKIRWALPGRGKRGGAGYLLLAHRRVADFVRRNVRQE